MYIAFYKKHKTFYEKLVRLFTKSKYVHCELVTIKLNKKFYGYTSMPGEGVVCGWKEYNENDWDFVKINFGLNDIKDFFDKTDGKGYDYLGAIGIVLGTPQNPDKYFCSEWCAEFLGIEKPWTVTPGKLYDMYKDKL